MTEVKLLDEQGQTKTVATIQPPAPTEIIEQPGFKGVATIELFGPDGDLKQREEVGGEG